MINITARPVLFVEKELYHNVEAVVFSVGLVMIFVRQFCFLQNFVLFDPRVSVNTRGKVPSRRTQVLFVELSSTCVLLSFVCFSSKWIPFLYYFSAAVLNLFCILYPFPIEKRLIYPQCNTFTFLILKIEVCFRSYFRKITPSVGKIYPRLKASALVSKQVYFFMTFATVNVICNSIRLKL